MRLHAEMLTDPSEAGDACVTLLLRKVGCKLFNTTRARARTRDLAGTARAPRWNTSPNTLRGKASRRRRRRRRGRGPAYGHLLAELF